ncbi:hypothetical protein CTAYLR_003575 [Chrysophaeum taylorii]|uniref:Uncharacterized protein n=1 Tax=Chrysophaeum taylorii TaxID=2483200 RepID=A0AAD7UMM1_9STRA|nr:hypothetical protein CTAYLR_003575 [Chrysophaeum taylorii]
MLWCAVLWFELVDIIATGRLEDLRRARDVQERYEGFKATTADAWGSLEDRILCDVFGVPAIERNGKRWARHGLATGKPRRIWRPNDFPYLTPPDVYHFVVWCSHDHLLDRAPLCAYVRQHLPDADVLCWINPPHLKSLPSIPHAHVLARKRPLNSAPPTLNFFRPYQNPITYTDVA